MAKKNHILFDITEIICIYVDSENKMKKKVKKASLAYDAIQSVANKSCRERKGLKVIESERIQIRTARLANPIEYYKFKEGRFFDEYKTGLRLFCKKNRITIYDEVDNN